MTLTAIKGKTSGLINPGVIFFTGIITLSLAGCVTSGKYQKQSPDNYDANYYPSSFYIQDVPFFPQEEYQCGPSVLASVFNFWGYKIDLKEISKAIYVENIKGTLKTDMVNFAKRFAENNRVSVYEVKGDIEIIREDIINGYPVIVFVDLGIWNIRKGHYMLIVGYDDLHGGIIAYSGVEKDKFILYNRFMQIWKRGGYWTLRIIPD